ncbi:SRPBCC family protein [bacterium]|nr:SRPBCC family protein [bacterium]MBU1615542.1 SRPBCC family protein [bacterium]
MIKVENTIIVNAPQKEVFSLASDFESWPEFMPSYKEVKITQRTEDRMVIERRGEVKGKLVFWKSEVRLEPPKVIKARQVEGPIPDMDIQWLFEEVEGGTKIVLIHNFEYKKIPLIGGIIGRLIAAKIVRRMAQETLEAIKRRMEGGK